MKIFARRIEAPEPHKPYATKWQIAVSGEQGAADPVIRFYDAVRIDGLSLVVVEETENPAVFVQPNLDVSVWGMRSGQPWEMLQ